MVGFVPATNALEVQMAERAVGIGEVAGSIPAEGSEMSAGNGRYRRDPQHRIADHLGCVSVG